MSVNWEVCDCGDVTKFSNVSFKELTKELKRSGIKFSKIQLNVPYYEGYWDSDFCAEILNVFAEVSDRLIEKDSAWIETLPDIVNAISKVANNGGMIRIG